MRFIGMIFTGLKVALLEGGGLYGFYFTLLVKSAVTLGYKHIIVEDSDQRQGCIHLGQDRVALSQSMVSYVNNDLD